MMTRTGIGWSSTGRTDRGARRKINEDAILLRPEHRVWLVADGMGGHEAGDLASGMVAKAVSVAAGDGTLAQRVDAIDAALIQVNAAIRRRATESFGGRTMGSTVVVLAAADRAAVCLWAGDSRLYRLRGDVLARLSSDHSEVQELFERGLLSAEEAANHPLSNVITRAVGGMQALALDIRLFDVQPGDILLLCSDGLYNELADDEIRAAIGDDLEASADRLLAETLARGARDNVSLVLARAEAS